MKPNTLLCINSGQSTDEFWSSRVFFLLFDFSKVTSAFPEPVFSL